MWLFESADCAAADSFVDADDSSTKNRRPSRNALAAVRDLLALLEAVAEKAERFAERNTFGRGVSS